MPVKIKKLKSSVFLKLKFKKKSCKLEDDYKQYLLNLTIIDRLIKITDRLG